MEWYQTIIKEICAELGITMHIVSKNWITILEKDGKTRFLAGQKFDLNPHGLGIIMDDKYAMYEVLSKKNIPVIEHRILFSEDNQDDYAKNDNIYSIVENYFKENSNNIVIKPNNGLCGLDVYHITNESDILPCLNQVFIKNSSISICPFYFIKAEYRLIALENECVLMYGKKRPIVAGDGKRTIRELLLELNPYYFKDKLEDDFYNKVLEMNEFYEYSWKFNLSNGAIPFEVEDENMKERLMEMFQKITKEIHLNFCSVDIIETDDGNLLVMELNSSVSFRKYCYFRKDGKELAKRIYKKAIQILFQ